MLQSAVQPVPPAVNRDRNVDELQSGVGKQAGLVKNDDIENVVGDPDGPVPDVLLYQQPDAQRARKRPHKLLPVTRKKSGGLSPYGMHSWLRLGFAGLIDIADGRFIDQQS